MELVYLWSFNLSGYFMFVCDFENSKKKLTTKENSEILIRLSSKFQMFLKINQIKST